MTTTTVNTATTVTLIATAVGTVHAAAERRKSCESRGGNAPHERHRRRHEAVHAFKREKRERERGSKRESGLKRQINTNAHMKLTNVSKRQINTNAHMKLTNVSIRLKKKK